MEKGLGKPRSKLGKWMDDRGIKQKWLIDRSGVNRTTVTELCNASDSRAPRTTATIQKIITALQEIDPTVKANMFWDL